MDSPHVWIGTFHGYTSSNVIFTTHTHTHTFFSLLSSAYLTLKGLKTIITKNQVFKKVNTAYKPCLILNTSRRNLGRSCQTLHMSLTRQRWVTRVFISHWKFLKYHHWKPSLRNGPAPGFLWSFPSLMLKDRYKHRASVIFCRHSSGYLPSSLRCCLVWYQSFQLSNNLGLIKGL